MLIKFPVTVGQCNFAASVGRIKPLVVGSLGPYGAHLADCSEYTGNYVDTVSMEVSLHVVLARLIIIVFSLIAIRCPFS